MKHVLITGGTGFIGQMLVKSLVSQGVEVMVITLESEKERVFKHALVNSVVCDLKNISSLENILPKGKYDTLYHLAWVGVSSTYKNNFEMQEQNIVYGYSVMKLALALGCKTVICTGSVSEYAYVSDVVNGNQIPCPADMYGAAKASLHIVCDLFARQNSINFRWLLIPSIYGPGREDNNIITYTIKSLLEGNSPDFTKLEQIWDYVYITDMIESLFLVGEKGKGSTVYVTGSGKTKPLYEYISLIRDKINPEAKLGIGNLPYKTSRIDNSVVDISRLVEDTGYCPKVSFEEGIEKTIEYFVNKSKGE